ncbi:MAG TPA: glycosyltransferase family 39 protein [Gaiellaceae bacterium]|nr:glycosyltransferase family 39 protein [Gaiellaceae bacterium]
MSRSLSLAPPSKRPLLPAAVAGAAIAVVVLALPAVWWGPLNVDEELTLRVADFSFGHVFHIVSTERGGGPVHFWLEHFLQGWWPGLPALRVPSLIFLVLALPAVALIAREVLGEEEAAAVVLLTAVSPVPITYATFGRPHTLLFAWLMWSTVLALRAARSGSRTLWVLAGAALGLSVLVHPTAPLYALVAFAAVLLYAPRARDAWPGAVALLVTFLPYYVKTLHVLDNRYGVGATRGGQRTFDGLPVWEDALQFVAPGGHDLNYFTVLALVGVVALVLTRRFRLLLFCAVTVAAPVVFFTVIPANGDSALFFDRYMMPVTPAFLVLVLAGIAALARWAGPARLPVIALLVAGLMAIELHDDVTRRNQVHGIRLDAVTHAVAREASDAVLFGSTGGTGPEWSTFDYGHPPNILDHYVSLRVDVPLVDDDACARVAPFLLGAQTPRHGLWLFYSVNGLSPFGSFAGVTVARPTPSYSVVRSTAALPPRRLVELGRRLRLAWRAADPVDARVNELLIADRDALRAPGSCPAYGQLGDPDISPHWPPVKGPQ